MPRRTPLLRALLFAGAAMLSSAACDADLELGGPNSRIRPHDLEARYQWALEGWTSSGRAVGQPTVQLTWEVDRDPDREVFRVYARTDRSGRDALIATVSSCAEGLCRYTDTDVRAGERYRYYVAAVDESRDGDELTSNSAIIAVPTALAPAAPRKPSVTALDGALYLRWEPAQGQNLRYRVVLTALNGARELYVSGETDGTAYVDTRTRNGAAYTYQLAAVDTLGHVSDLGAAVTGTPRPDAFGEFVYAFADSSARSGFRFSETGSRALRGDDPGAHWRLERTVANGAADWRLVPLGRTEVYRDDQFPTVLACGPAADPSCRAVGQASADASRYARQSVPAAPERTYVFRVVGDDGRSHYAKVRVAMLGFDAGGKALMVFDWAYQLRPDDRNLNRVGG